MFSNLYERIVNGEEKISLVGLGYVGMPIAVAFAKKLNVIFISRLKIIFIVKFIPVLWKIKNK